MSDEQKNGQSKTTQLSSNTTLFWRVFVPIAGFSFWVAMNIGVWLLEAEYINIPILSGMAARILMFGLLLGWLAYSWYRLLGFYRVEANETHVFVTNYWHNVRYLWEDVVRLERTGKYGIVELKSAGRFGKTMRFIPSRTFDDWAIGREV